MTTNTSINRFGSRRRAGAALVYITVTMVAMMGLVSLAVDLARVRLTKTQLQGAADAAARAAAGAVPNGSTAAKNKAVAAGATNNADGSTVVINPNNVQIGVWNSASKTFTATTVNPNAVKVSVGRTAAAGNAVPLLFARIIGRTTCDVNVTSIAMLTGSAAVNVPGHSNPWLAGMPTGNYGGPDVSGTAPQNSAVQVTTITVTPGATMSFQVSGSCADDPININKAWDPDGCSDGTGIRTNDSGYLNGMSNLKAQQGALIGVFLNNNAPNSGSAPPDLDMSTSAGMNYNSISPQLKQPFFIGDGINETNGQQQQVVVPAGATRLFLAMHDNINWQNNSGYFLVTFNGSGAARVVTVK